MILYRFMGECVIYYEIRHLNLISLQIDVKLENAGKLKLRYPLWSDFGGEDGRVGHNHEGAMVDGDLLVYEIRYLINKNWYMNSAKMRDICRNNFSTTMT